ncbi:hypothetical protein COCC4DRAFT_60749 [Bipolaris maydis ATCC 48331]|uniref:Myb-like domain-containing protein n=2 Tax=Cochliobolus heterostrophus TaxID=5016 RepID=M2U6M6_COCH5|nr:uncharacterized protein COCC4DRAFT_60749 [Bipolaris maydis ATCC 48331]EMD89371.1 hypothetical protein COCHEDRAFT_1216102 [Bipolaris maydis C5]KAJ5025006.1 hypothetical protein J3E73DRAFT_192675 [Bipolaris maydis]ENI04912.1 hypothetical protein COCC4DRAFT_60749 [Bipolaris maydis ATCC 48331]KAJ5057226.1 hypothetical protein J3E74DRAFT_409911 [Bipolaris maydis]KAJ6212719.1 hypothetical protein PSV09DRAFT_1216102 [Bipolaris maydis]
MADSRGVRSAGRRETPTPQPPLSKTTATQMARTSRARSLRSASREITDFVPVEKPTRRSARQASVTSVTGENESEEIQARQTRREAMKEMLEDLTVVEEMDTQLALDEIEPPGTPEHATPEIPMPFRSPGAISEMSGTTAISSFSMVEAEFLESRFIMKHLRKLCDSAVEFLEHIAPSGATMSDDLRNIKEMQKPGSAYSEEYLDYEIELNVHLKHFKSEDHSYIRVRALHRALFGTDEQTAASDAGLDLILYLTNLLVFAKQMIYSDRDDKTMWDVLRQLDNTFPVQFMRSLDPNAQPSGKGESRLFRETFLLALELRTQLAILVLQKLTDDLESDPEETVSEIFFRSESSQAVDGSPLRGWNIVALGGDEAPLPQELQDQVAERLNEIRDFFPTDEDSLQRGELVELERLREKFPWEATILRLLAWVRLRRKELLGAIEDLGGAAVIASDVKKLHEEPQPVVEQANGPSIPQASPWRKRTSFGRERRRSSRKFNPNAAVDFRAIDMLKARERDSGVDFEVNPPRQEQNKEPIQQVAEVEGMEGEGEGGEEQVQGEEEPLAEPPQQDGIQPVLESDEQQQQTEEGPRDPQDQAQPGEVTKEREDQSEEPVASDPPQSSAALLKCLKAVGKPQKENRPVSIFDRQVTAQRVEFGDGFDETQPTPGPSNTNKAKPPPESSSHKRPRSTDDSYSDDAFESGDRGLRVLERRRNAPRTKRVRIDPSSSAPPPSHQPPPRPTQSSRQSPEQAESFSETEAPEMTEEIPSSNYQAQRQLAQENQRLQSRRYRNERKPRKGWSNEEEDAMCEYMRMYPGKYSTILTYDKSNGNFLEGRTQVNLKDKVRNMALNMIKYVVYLIWTFVDGISMLTRSRSGTGLRPGFEYIVHPKEKYGAALVESGWLMRDDGEWVRQEDA